MSEASILQCGKSVKSLRAFLDNFDQQHDVSPVSSSHSQGSLTKDESAVLEVLTQTCNTFDYIPVELMRHSRISKPTPQKSLTLENYVAPLKGTNRNYNTILMSHNCMDTSFD